MITPNWLGFGLAALIATCAAPVLRAAETVYRLPDVVVEGDKAKLPVVEPGAVTRQPRAISQVPPRFPTGFRQLLKGETAIVVKATVSFIVDATGKPVGVKPTRVVLNSQFTEQELRAALGRPAAALKTLEEVQLAAARAFAEPATAAVTQWRFEPAERNGTKVAANMEVEVQYRVTSR